MTDTLIIEKAINEIILKEFGTTEQLLDIHEVVYENDKPKVIGIDKEFEDGTAIVYFPIKGERFYLAVWLNTDPEVLVRSVGTENYNSVFLKVTSKYLNLLELTMLTKLQATGSWSKGDKRNLGESIYNYSALQFEPNPEPGGFETKVKKLLDFLDKDKEGITNLISKTDAQIQVVTIFHNGNTMLGGLHLDKSIIKRIASYNLEMDFDLYAEGNFFKD